MSPFWVNKIITVVSIVIVSVSSADDPSEINWCSPALNCDKEQTYACTKCPVTQGCEIMEDIMTVPTRSVILNVHNSLRNNVAMGQEKRLPEAVKNASNMIALSYDMNLEYLAECWIKRCEFKHTPCQRMPPGTQIGQNLHQTSSCSIQGVIQGVKDWYETEIEKTPSNAYSSYVFGKDWGHYSQVIWAKTTSVGCSFSKNTKDGKCILACNYSPAGNFQKQPIFERGQPASKCPSGKKQNPMFKGLCGTPKEYNQTNAEKTTAKTSRSQALKTTEKITTPVATSEKNREGAKESEDATTQAKEGKDEYKSKTSATTENSKKILETATDTDRKEDNTEDNKKSTDGDKNTNKSTSKAEKQHMSKTETELTNEINNSEVVSKEKADQDRYETISDNNLSDKITYLPWMTKHENLIKATSTLPKLTDLPWMKDRYVSDEVKASEEKPKDESKIDDLPWMMTPEKDEFLPISINDLPWVTQTPTEATAAIDLPKIIDLPWVSNSTQITKSIDDPLEYVRLHHELPWLKHSFIKIIDKRSSKKQE